MLKPCLNKNILEAGCDEAGRGCLAGPVYAAAVILPKGFRHKRLNDSKQICEEERFELREIIQGKALCYAVASCDNNEIDEMNILQASICAMHRALAMLNKQPEFILVDGNYFRPYQQVPHKTIIEGDAIYMNIAAASILAKTYRDDYMVKLHEQFPQYSWKSNKGYATPFHRQILIADGPTPYHRKSFKLKEEQLLLPLE